MASETSVSSDTMSGLNASEAKAFHGVFMRSFWLFTFYAFIIHMIVLYFKPWTGVIE